MKTQFWYYKSQLSIFFKNGIFNKRIDKRCNEILELSKKNNYDDLTYHSKDRNVREISFYDFNNVISLFKKIRDGNNMMLENAKLSQNKFSSDLNEAKNTGRKESRR